jgi:hypothetical protein
MKKSLKNKMVAVALASMAIGVVSAPGTHMTRTPAKTSATHMTRTPAKNSATS